MTIEDDTGNINVPTIVDTCVELVGGNELTTGVWNFGGDLTGWTNDQDPSIPGPSCTGWEAAAPDGNIEVILQPGEQISVI